MSRTFADERRRVDGDRSDDASVRRGLRLARRDAENDAEDTQPRGAVTVTGCRFSKKRLARRRDSVAERADQRLVRVVTRARRKRARRRYDRAV